MNKVNWWRVAILALAVVIVLLLGSSVLPVDGGNALETGRDTMHWGATSAAGGWWLWRPLFGLAMPVLWLTLLILGIVWLARAVSALPGQGAGGSAGKPALAADPQGEACAECGRPVQTTWQVCPHCGHKLP